jgi:hypothetical protein
MRADIQGSLLHTRWSIEIAPGPRAMIKVSSDSHRMCSG